MVDAQLCAMSAHAAASKSAALPSSALALSLRRASADESTHKYTDGEELALWVNKVGPYHNPQETYVYCAPPAPKSKPAFPMLGLCRIHSRCPPMSADSLPFCSTKPVADLEHRWDALGEVLEGNDLISSGLSARFKEPVKDHTKICSVKLTEDAASQFAYAVRNHYWDQLYLDDLPIWGMVGEVSATDADEAGNEPEGEALVYTHKKFSISSNGNRIIQVNLTSENPASVSAGVQLDFTYAIEWSETDTTFPHRFDR